MQEQPGNSKYILLFFLLLFAGVVLYLNIGPIPGVDVPRTPTPATVVPPTPPPQDPLLPIDQILNESLSGSIAYNVPSSMRLSETITLELLLNPSMTGDQIKEQIEESGTIVTDTVRVSPLMKAELIPHNSAALGVQALHDTPEQPVSPTETTRWQWLVTAKEGGTQGLTIIVYRLIQFEGKDYWREVESYKANITVQVTLTQRLQAFDWKWLGGILLTSMLIPAFWRMVDKRKQAAKSKRGVR